MTLDQVRRYVRSTNHHTQENGVEKSNHLRRCVITPAKTQTSPSRPRTDLLQYNTNNACNTRENPSHCSSALTLFCTYLVLPKAADRPGDHDDMAAAPPAPLTDAAPTRPLLRAPVSQVRYISRSTLLNNNR